MVKIHSIIVPQKKIVKIDYMNNSISQTRSFIMVRNEYFTFIKKS
jgi:hypothetical protein